MSNVTIDYIHIPVNHLRFQKGDYLNTMKMFSLKTKILLAVSTLIVLLVLVMSYLTLSSFENTFKETIAEQENTLITVIAQQIDEKLDVSHKVLIDVAENITPDILEDPDDVQYFLNAHYDTLNLFDNHVTVFSPTGRLIAEAPYSAESRGLDYSSREYIQKTLQTEKPYLSTPYISSQQNPAITMTAPVFNKKGDLIAILAGSIDLTNPSFLGDLPNVKIGENGYLFMFSTDRTIIMHPDPASIMQKDTAPGVNTAFDNAIAGLDVPAETINSHGIPVLMTTKHLQHTNWVLAASHPISEIYVQVDEAKRHFFIIAFLGTVLLLVITGYVIKKMMSPLAQFIRHVEEMPNKEGLQKYCTINSNDEIGALANAFNKMVEELDKKTKSLEKSEELYRTITEFASDMVFWRAPDHKLLYVSPNCKQVTGYNDTDFYNKPELLDEIVYDEDVKQWLEYNVAKMKKSQEFLEFRVVTPTGDIRWINAVTLPVFDETNTFMGIRGSYRDITQRKIAEEQLKYVSMHDPLTTLYNRAQFEAELTRLELEYDVYSPVSIVVCDINGLKLINDIFGHRRGDISLIKAAEVLKKSFPEHASIYRIGGDEFVCLLPNSDKPTIEKALQAIRTTVKEFNAEDPELLLSISAGFSISEAGPPNMTELFKEADDNMYREKLLNSQSTRSTIVQALMKTLEARDFVTEGHANRLHKLVANLGAKIGIPENSMANLRLLAHFHDIGKVGIPDYILFKAHPLDEEERLIMQRHSEIGHRIAKSAPELASIADLILKHHEWWNGTGYPLGLQGDDIPLECRILALADAYDAMTSNRPYRKALSHEVAITEIQKCAGGQFDPHLVEQFATIMNEMME